MLKLFIRHASLETYSSAELHCKATYLVIKNRILYSDEIYVSRQELAIK